MVENCAQSVQRGVLPSFFFLAKKKSEGMDTKTDSTFCYRWIVKFDGFFIYLFFCHLKKYMYVGLNGMEEMRIQ